MRTVWPCAAPPIATKAVAASALASQRVKRMCGTLISSVLRALRTSVQLVGLDGNAEAARLELRNPLIVMARESGPSSTPQPSGNGEKLCRTSSAVVTGSPACAGDDSGEAEKNSCYACRTSANTAKYRSESVQTWRESQPEPRASAANDGRVYL